MFYLDGHLTPNSPFLHVPNGVDGFSYGQVVYSNVNLSPNNHTVVISAVPDGKTALASLILFDYAVYT